MKASLTNFAAPGREKPAQAGERSAILRSEWETSTRTSARPFTPSPYDVVVLGAGRMGALAAHFLMWSRPGLKLLLLDQGGLPNEEGATILAPGVWSALGVPEAQRERAELTRRLIAGELSAEEGGLGLSGPHDAPTLKRGLVDLLPQAAEGSVPVGEIAHLPPDLVDPALLPLRPL